MTSLNAYQVEVNKAIVENQYTGVPKNETDYKNGWDFTSALLFTITIVTTIGGVSRSSRASSAIYK